MTVSPTQSLLFLQHAKHSSATWFSLLGCSFPRSLHGWLFYSFKFLLQMSELFRIKQDFPIPTLALPVPFVLLCFTPYHFSLPNILALVVKNPPANSGDIRDLCSIPVLGRSPGGGDSNPLQYFCLKNPKGRGAWWATIHRVAENQTWLRWLSTILCIYLLIIYCMFPSTRKIDFVCFVHCLQQNVHS